MLSLPTPVRISGSFRERDIALYKLGLPLRARELSPSP